MSAAAPTAILRQLHVTTTEDVASDEPYLQVNGKTVWGPRSVDEGDNRTIGVVAHAGDKVRLYEQDGDVPFDDDDFLGEATVKGVGGTLRFSRDDARYSLSYGPRPSTADYILKRGPNRSAAIERLDDRLRKSGVQKLLSKANRKLSRADCGKSDRAAVPAGSVVYCWKSGDDKTSEWYPQGVTTTSDANADERWGRKRALIVTWYDAGRSPKKGVRLSFVDPARKRYRHVLLVYPTGTKAKPNYRRHRQPRRRDRLVWQLPVRGGDQPRRARLRPAQHLRSRGLEERHDPQSQADRLAWQDVLRRRQPLRAAPADVLRQRGGRARELLRRGGPAALMGLDRPQPAAGHADDRRVLQGREGPDRALARARPRSVQVARGARAVGQLPARRVRPGRYGVARHVLVHAQGRAPAGRRNRGRLVSGEWTAGGVQRNREDVAISKGPEDLSCWRSTSRLWTVAEHPADRALYGIADSRCR